jgi:hypothetical protein
MPRIIRKLAVLLLVGIVTLASEVPGGMAQWRPARSQWPTTTNAPPAERFQPANEPIQTGYLFVEGKYIAPPYTLGVTEGQLVINGEVAALPSNEFPRSSEDQEGRWGWRGRMPRQGQGRFLVRRVRINLEQENIVVLFANQPPVILDLPEAKYQFFRTVLGAPSPRETSAGEMDWLPAEADRAQWRSWLEAYTPPSNLRARAEPEIRAVEEEKAASEAKAAADRRLDTWHYPLTVAGMVLVVVALGHLLTARPGKGNAAANSEEASEARKAVVRSLVLILVLSGLDLVWTILVSSAGVMRELNPLGQRFIEDPAQLIGFKALLTLAAIGLLFGLRRFHAAQVGAWWACLICTLLIVRWLTFNSLFV